VNRYIAVCHARGDRDGAAMEFCQALVELGFVVKCNECAPRSLAGGSDVDALAEALSVGVVQCCYSVVLVTRNLLAYSWAETELKLLARRAVEWAGRVICVCGGVSFREVPEFSRAFAEMLESVTGGRIAQSAGEMSKWVAPDLSSGDERIRASGIDERLVEVLGCAQCEDHPKLELEGVTAPPLGATGLLVCPRCRAAYPIRGGIPRLRRDNVILPSYPTSDW